MKVTRGAIMNLQEMKDYLDSTFKPNSLADAKVVMKLLNLSSNYLTVIEGYEEDLKGLPKLKEENRVLRRACEQLREAVLDLREDKDNLEGCLICELMEEKR